MSIALVAIVLVMILTGFVFLPNATFGAQTHARLIATRLPVTWPARLLHAFVVPLE
jgi:hypothetical protein